LANYKGVDVKESVRALLTYMPLIDEYRENLLSLQAVWDNLSLLGQLSGTTADIGHTREAFTELTTDLLNSLAERTLAKCEQEMTSKAQVLIDILVRNLFERTADIGFLTTDALIREFAQNGGNAADIQRRFDEYVRKYSVYGDIALLDCTGKILARLCPDERVSTLQEDWVRESMSTSKPYIEAYVHSRLFPDQARTLIYAYRVSSEQGATLAVLALCFRFSDEMDRIFGELSGAENSSVMVLLDASGEVIASSDRWQIPIGAQFNLTTQEIRRIRFAGRTYLARACVTKGYQGYMGPGWLGMVMTPVDLAFDLQYDDKAVVAESAEVASAIAGGRAFPESLQSIPRKAEAIKQDLRRSVWNGMIRQSSISQAANSNFSKILLREISGIGLRMGDVFSRSIGNLQTTVLSSLMADCLSGASLAINIMDRNLYERANDCRWWALDPVIASLLAMADGQTRRQGIEQVLRYINGLYTVYANLMVFDVKGVVLAVSNPAYDTLVGAVLDEAWVIKGLAIQNSQQYVVSEFVRTPLYADRPTYIYAAVLRSSATGDVIGGIGIVFDSEPQFAAMLHDSLPRQSTGAPVEGSFALFVDAQSIIISSSDPNYRVGDLIALPSALIAPAAEGSSCLMEFNGHVVAVGARRSAGYREYKGADDAYRNDVTALVLIPLGAFDANAGTIKPAVEMASKRAGNAAGEFVEIATFCVCGHWLGLPVAAVAEATELRGFVRLPNTPKHIFGAQIYGDETLPLYNLHVALGLPEPAAPGLQSDSKRQVVVVKGGDGEHFGILVDELGDVLEVPPTDIAELARVYVGVTPVLASVIKTPPKEGAPLVVLLSVESMVEQLRQ
jgi:chemotaxis signal transduction protein